MKFALVCIGIVFVAILTYFVMFFNVVDYDSVAALATSTIEHKAAPTLDKAAYDAKMLSMSHILVASTTLAAHPTLDASTTLLVASSSATKSVSVEGKLWPAAASYPLYGAILPFHRIVAYYGNFYSKGMGVLGEYDHDTVLAKLRDTVAQWEAADPSTPVIPAIEYIDVTAQAAAGKDGMYRARMADSQIDKALDMAHEVGGIVVLDIQVGLSTVQQEVPLIDTYLAKPDVHLALDPEFAMWGGHPPGTVIGTLDASTINWAIAHLSKIVDDNHLPPKILVIHRFTTDMVTNAELIRPTPEVQVVMQMDGWGSPQRKINTYVHVVMPEPVQFTGFKLFYKNDLKENPPRLMTPAEVLRLTPSPMFIQYQ
jgi:hypothetical protein